MANAAAETECTYYHYGLPGVHFYRQFFAPSTCYVDITPMDTEGLVYRSYLFSEQGLFMVFNSYGDGKPSEKTGARVFYFLPRETTPHGISENGDLKIQTGSVDTVLIIDGTTSKLKSLARKNIAATLIESPEVNATNQGGVEIKDYHGLLIDTGFALGKDPKTDPNRKSLITDQNGKSCRIKNKDLFNYDNSDEAIFKRSDLEFKKYLSQVCPELTPGY